MVLAIDLGGTKLISAIISDEGQVLAREYVYIQSGEGPQAVIDQVVSAIDGLLKVQEIGLSQVHGISIAVAGAIDMKKGIVTLSPNLPGWHDIPLRDIIQEKYRVNTCLINDASAAALGEHRLGAGKGLKNLILLTVGTGIGGGIIIDDKLYLGPCGTAGEIGHMTIDINGPRCDCGNIGCLEKMVSGTAVALEAIRRISRGERSALTKLVAGKIENITADAVGVAARDGDSLALDIIENAAAYLGAGMVNLVNIFNPEMIIIGGGLAKMGDLLLATARGVVLECAYQLPAQAVRIVTAQLGDDAGVIGAALFAFQKEFN
jgi:glucokinase